MEGGGGSHTSVTRYLANIVEQNHVVLDSEILAVHLRTDVFCKPFSAFAILVSAQLSKTSFLFLIQVLPEKRVCKNQMKATLKTKADRLEKHVKRLINATEKKCYDTRDTNYFKTSKTDLKISKNVQMKFPQDQM